MFMANGAKYSSPAQNVIKSRLFNSGSQTFMSGGPLQATLNTCGPLLIDKNT